MNLLVEPTIVTTADRPDLVPLVAGWLWDAFWRSYGCTLQQVLDDVGGAVARVGPPQCFVLLQAGQPVGTASLAAKDLDTRPDLTPWLAGVWVAPDARGRGHATRLIRAVEAACRAAALPEL